jgi:hypothetical protein
VTKFWVLALSAAALTGCAGDAGPALAPPRGEESVSAAPSPILVRPSAPPRDPTDDSKATTVIVGTVNRGGDGPCYGLSTDDGVQYALYEAKGRALPAGIRITVDALPSRLRIDCGPGTLVEVKTLTALR